MLPGSHELPCRRIREMFARDFAEAEMECIVENIFEDGDWAILEWRDPLGMRGCGFVFHIPARHRLGRGRSHDQRPAAQGA